MKKSNLLLIIAFAALVLAAVLGLNSLKKHYKPTSYAEGENFEMQHELQNFNHIEVEGSLRVNFTEDSEAMLIILADSATHDKIVIKEEEGRLKISLTNWKSKRVDCQLRGPVFSNLEVAAGARFQSEDTLKGKDLIINSSSGASTSLYGQFENVDASVSSGATITLRGEGEHVSIAASSGSTAKLIDYMAKRATVSANSGSSVYVNGKEVDATASSGSSVYYNDNTVLRTVNTSSGAKIKKM